MSSRTKKRTDGQPAAGSQAEPGQGAGFGNQLAPSPDYAAHAREICLRLLTVRARTRAELAQALARRGVPDDVAGRVLDRLTDVGLIDDAAVARAVVEGQVARGLARRAVAVKLRQRGVADTVVGIALDEIPAGAELAAARSLATRRQRQLARLPPEVQARRLSGQLARRGYSADVISRVVRETVHLTAPEDGSDAL